MAEEKQDLRPVVIEQPQIEDISEKTDLEEKRDQVSKIVLGFAAGAGATGAIPLPFADSYALTVEQIVMLNQIGRVYGINVGKIDWKEILIEVLSVTGVSYAGKLIVSSLFKLIPGVGTIGGAAICGTTAAGMTIALGRAFGALFEAVYKGELSEQEMFADQGRRLLKTTYQNELRLGMSEKPEAEPDVLQELEVPADEQPIELAAASDNEFVPAKTPEESDPEQ